MPSQEDYANVAFALSALASAPVAAYPNSGPALLAQQAQDRAVAKLSDEAIKKAQKKANKKGKLGKTGQLAGTVVGAALAAPTGGMSMLGGAALGGQIGGAAGDLAGGGTIDGVGLAQALAESKASAEGSGEVSTLNKVKTPMQRRRTKNPVRDSLYNEYMLP